MNFRNRVFCLVLCFTKLVIFLENQNVLKSCDATYIKGYAHSSVCPPLCPSVCPCSSIHRSVLWFSQNHFAWWVKTKIANDLGHAYGLVINLKMVGQKCLSANLYVWQSICLSLKSAAHASFQDLQLVIKNTNGGFTVGFFFFL